MTVRKLIVFKHEGVLGNAPSHILLDRIRVNRKDSEMPARSYSDYEIIINKENMPNGVEVYEKI